MSNGIDDALLAVLACPKCREPLRSLPGELECTSSACGLVYPVRDGIPVLLIDEARPPAKNA
jgi:uncharacterized protein YbaR (Trm112 family)